MPRLQRRGDVFILWLAGTDAVDDDARFHPDRMAALHAALDEVEASDGPAALVTANAGKFFSNGLDLDYILPKPDRLDAYLDEVHALFSRLLVFSTPTVAAVQGHAFGAGAMLATAHDFRVMRADRGFYCLPEVTLQMPFTPSMSALMTRRLPPQVALEAMTTGRRYGGRDALAAGIVDAVADGSASADAVLDAAVARAQELAPLRGANLAGIKRGIHAELLEALARKTAGTRIGG
ncbi:enoyl-CoA hydratase/isomerase family protein [Tomitella fengzijianii]|uniref:Enoyl-CoA hydratase/isomerase family protein n=1 Tax=Tomitella fengzijianii TaxID=2597660 RepID=A0A516X7I8_9ACTN|nr:enoyl-CoA hydratase/isomerase family protein [Tomitella fengzijianii]QDQ99032.1 enoyl-CoA hydratase/isomerase family protein [Tomitella fengzijianii]